MDRKRQPINGLPFSVYPDGIDKSARGAMRRHSAEGSRLRDTADQRQKMGCLFLCALTELTSPREEPCDDTLPIKI